jgi:hypothetical protein
MRTEDLKTLYLGVILLDITSAMFDELDKEVDLFAMPINLSNMAKIILVFYSHCKPVSYFAYSSCSSLTLIRHIFDPTYL